MGRSHGWRAYLPLNLSHAVRCVFSVHVFHVSYVHMHAPIVLSAFLFSLATRDVRPQCTPHSFLHLLRREVNFVHVTYVFRLFSVCGCNVIFPVKRVMPLLSFALPLLSRNRRCMMFVRVHGPVQFLKARTDSLPFLRFL